MRICVLTPYFYPHTGGSERYIEELYTRVLALVPDLHVDVVCYNTDGAARTQKYRGLTVHRVGCLEVLPNQFAVPNYWEVLQVIRSLKRKYGKYDIVNSHTRFFDNSWWAPLVAKYLGAKSVLTDHCADHPQHPSFIVNFVTQTLDTVVIPYLSHVYDQVTVVSQATQKFLAQKGLRNSIVIFAGVDSHKFSSRKKEVATRKVPGSKKTFTKKEVVISFVGRMISTKNPLVVLQAAQKITAKYPHVQFCFAGAGQLATQVKTAQTPQIHFLGKLTSENVALLLQASDIFIHPSSHHEGLPIAVLEAGAAGCAVVATDNGGTTEVILDQKTGLITTGDGDDVVKKLEKLIKDTTLRQRLGRQLQKHVAQHFDWSVITKNFIQHVVR